VDLILFRVDPEKCKRCGVCFRSCPAGAITWEKKQVAEIDQSKCTRCRTCIVNCRFDAID
jgi:ferredoxin